MKKVVLITTGQPSVNPRIVKEADALQAAGFEVTVLYCFWINWAAVADLNLLRKVKWNYRLVGGSPDKSKLLYYLTKARFKISETLQRLIGNRLFSGERSQARCFDELLKAAKSIKAEWYIGHNLGALSIAVIASAHNSGACGFDFEDYHREENLGTPLHRKSLIEYLEKKYIPRLNYISASSPLIAKRVKLDFPTFRKPIITLLNCFPISHRSTLISKRTEDKMLRLFWFSQTIGKDRGLETVVAALVKLKNPFIQLTLVGRLDEEMKKYLDGQDLAIREAIHVHGIVEPEELPALASQHDVGLATELTVPLNRDLCLTNKIFTYLVAGNCILASDTSAQKEFMERYPGIGLSYTSSNSDDLAKQIRRLYLDRKLLKCYREGALQLARTSMNWESESKKLLHLI